jgi:hypothetical protein
MIMSYLIKSYFILAQYLCPSLILQIKNKEGHNYSYTNDEKKIRELEKQAYLEELGNYYEKEDQLIQKCKNEIIKNHKCGYCKKHITIPQYMYADKIFCSKICRYNIMERDDYYSNKNSISCNF